MGRSDDFVRDSEHPRKAFSKQCTNGVSTQWAAETTTCVTVSTQEGFPQSQATHIWSVNAMGP